MVKNKNVGNWLVLAALLHVAVTGCKPKVQLVESEVAVNQTRASENSPQAVDDSLSASPIAATVDSDEAVSVANVQAPTVESPETQVPQLSPEKQAVKQCEVFAEIAKHYTEGDSVRERDFASDISQMKVAFDEILSISIVSSECLIAQEVLGEVAFELASILQQNFNKEPVEVGKAVIGPYDPDTLRVFAWKAFRKAASLGSQNAYTYDRLARLKLLRTGGRWEDPELVENILESMRLSPENGMSIRMLVLALLNSTFVNTGAFDNELGRVLPLQTGKAKAELERALDFLEGQWEDGQRHAERAAILGYIDVSAQNEMMRDAKLKGMLRAALGIGPFERRTNATANK